MPVRAGWIPVSLGAGGAAVAVAERAALGTSVRVAVWPPDALGPALAAVDAELGGSTGRRAGSARIPNCPGSTVSPARCTG